MRRPLLLAALAVSGACVYLPPLGPSVAEQAVENDPHSASAEVASVRITVHPDDWRGYPSDLDEYVTPVELFIENGSAKELAIRQELFTLALPDGYKYDALSPGELRRIVGRGYYGGGSYWYYGAYGVYPWPGFFMPWPHYYPYVWWGDPWYGPALPPPPPRGPSPSPTPSGKLAAGGRVSVLVFFPVPADSLNHFAFEANVVASDGATLGTLKVPFERRPVRRAGPRAPAPPTPSGPPRAAAPRAPEPAQRPPEPPVAPAPQAPPAPTPQGP